MIKPPTLLLKSALAIAGALLICASPGMADPSQRFYQQTNLVSDLPGVATFTDPDLVNPWGVSFSPTGPFWVSDNGTGKSTLYDGAGVKQSLVVIIPPAAATPQSISTPTGQVFNGTTDFVINAGGVSSKAIFLFVTEDGTLSAWNSNAGTNALLVADNSASGAIYKGLAIGSNSLGNFLYAANFYTGTIDVFDKNFAPVTLSGSFSDPDVPAGYAPFNIQNLGGKLYVTYAKQNDAKDDEVACRGCGFVSVFDTDGRLLMQLASRGTLNAPWGLALAPADFGYFSNTLLVGNFGNGYINAFDPNTGQFRGRLRTPSGRLVAIDGLWSLNFGNGATAGSTNTLFFTAGIEDETHGLFGSLTSVPADSSP